MAAVGSPDTIEMGNFVVGEVPVPVEYTFNDFDGNPIDISGASTKEFRYWTGDNTPAVGTGTTTTPGGGVIKYEWVAADFAAAGTYYGRFWAEKGGVTFASPMIIWYVEYP